MKVTIFDCVFFVSGQYRKLCREEKERERNNVFGMNEIYAVLLLFLATASPTNFTRNNELCQIMFLANPNSANDLNFDYSFEVSNILSKIESNSTKFSQISQELLSRRTEIVGVFLSSSSGNRPTLALNFKNRLKIFLNQTPETEPYWKSFQTATHRGWNPPFRDCFFVPKTWFHSYVIKTKEAGVAIFVPLKLNQCNNNLAEIFGGPHRCDTTTTNVSSLLRNMPSFLPQYTVCFVID